MKFAVLLWLGVGVSACGAASEQLYVVSTASPIAATAKAGSDAKTNAEAEGQPKAPATAETKPGLVGKDCDVRLFLEQLPGGRTTFGTPDRHLGSTVVERDIDGKYTNGVCVKHAGLPLKLPAAMLVAAVNGGVDFARFCREETWSGKLRSPVTGADEVAVNVCTWNGMFHSPRPFTVTLAAGPSAAVGDYVEIVRVYRNGDLMAAWNRVSDQPNPELVVIPGQVMVTSWFAATLPPHLSTMDLRMIPRSDQVAVGVATETRDDHARFESRLKDAFGAALDVELPPGSDERKSLQCLLDQLKGASQVLMHPVSAASIVSPPINANCHPLIDAGAETPLSEAYASVKKQAAGEVDRLKREAFATIAKYREDLLKALPAREREELLKLLLRNLSEGNKELLESCVLTIETTGADMQCLAGAEKKGILPKRNIDAYVAAVRALDQRIALTLATADEARALAGRLANKTKELVNDVDKQAEVFNAFVQSLQAKGDVFEPRRDNPALVSGEQKIDMLYGDKWQGFMLAPWNGVPMRMTHNLQADFNAATALPLLDVAGFRYQWGKSRFADFRMAAGIGYVETEEPASGKKQAACMPNASIGFGTLKVGAGLVTGEGQGKFEERARLIIGADLYKLISGSNAEVL
jgi:hypothetical protein